MINTLKNKLSNYKPYINGHKNMKKASVLIPIVKKDGSFYILFQVRSKTLRSQPNEISFPGGKIELNETPYDACIRETCEELGTFPDNIQIISELDLLITPANLIIHPYVGILDNIETLNINKDEVDHIFLVPISYLLKYEPNYYNNEVKIIPDNNFPYDIIPNKENYKFGKGNYEVLFYKYNNYIIWGITAKILQNFLEVLND
ncbi:NUDIX hydrolase [Romboutsia lituseburensis]|uniref:NUDIX domain-containing protein n=1 Tax=Romboutsia lituseburensis DSM 797 TaxID=1121325 RepID=A0A1G9MD10_9FIRM|nr:CoA pyrophosphatase [Romboutsia lituseburensis]CEH34521.1 Hydrolase, NUDIX [Romboutsia lituseburensis]SDL71797.1 NUDIX domain-containing protein [Romboutsia lituseburensis DSM 797]